MSQSTCPRCNQPCPANEMNAYGGHEDCDVVAPTTPLGANYTPDEKAIIKTMQPKNKELYQSKEGRAKTNQFKNGRYVNFRRNRGSLGKPTEHS